MAHKVIDGTFFQGKAEGGIISTKVTKSTGDWEVLDLLNEKGKAYWRVWILWNDYTTRDYYTAIYKQDLLTTPQAPLTTVAKPF